MICENTPTALLACVASVANLQPKSSSELIDVLVDVRAQIAELRREIAGLRTSRNRVSDAFATVLSVEDVCELLGCKKRQVFKLLESGGLERAPKHGKALRIYKASVDRLLTPSLKRSRKRRAQAFEPAKLEDIPVFKR